MWARLRASTTPRRVSTNSWRRARERRYPRAVRRVLTGLILVLGCEPSATVGPLERTPEKPEDRAISASADALPSELPNELRVRSRDTLPGVDRWLPDARRCGRYGRRRYCNGPRRAPEPTGPAAKLAERLELGTHRAAAELIRAEPRPEWLEAVEALRLTPPEHLVWPVDGGRFGRGVQRRGRRDYAHRGVDVSAEIGTPVRALGDGLVGYANNSVDGYGNLLVLLHAGGEVSAYAHLDAIHVHAGQVVRAGQVVARSGNTGLSRGPHLHFEWREQGRVADPMRRFPESNVPRWMQPLLARVGR